MEMLLVAGLLVALLSPTHELLAKKIMEKNDKNK
jgi:hypothetical protein